MPRCSRFSKSLAQFVADGEPHSAANGPLMRHLASCPVCREETARLRVIEQILRTYPKRPADPVLTQRIMLNIAQDERIRARFHRDEERPLVWDIWLPAMTLLLVVMILALSMPERLTAGLNPLHIDTNVLYEPVILPELLPGLRIRGGDTVFWAFWSSFFAVASGIGIWVSLSAWNVSSDRVVAQMAGQISAIVERLIGRGQGDH